MQRLSLHLCGPIRRPLWNRLRRRVVRTSSAGAIATVFAGGTLYVASAVEPNLSGVWVREDGTELRLFHVGSRVTAVFEADGGTSFVARFASGSKLEGYINLWWQDEEMRESCGQGAMVDHTFEAAVQPDYDTMEERWTQTFADEVTCAPTSSRVRSETLKRKRTVSGRRS